MCVDFRCSIASKSIPQHAAFHLKKAAATLIALSV